MFLWLCVYVCVCVVVGVGLVFGFCVFLIGGVLCGVMWCAVCGWGGGVCCVVGVVCGACGACGACGGGGAWCGVRAVGGGCCVWCVWVVGWVVCGGRGGGGVGSAVWGVVEEVLGVWGGGVWVYGVWAAAGMGEERGGGEEGRT